MIRAKGAAICAAICVVLTGCSALEQAPPPVVSLDDSALKQLQQTRDAAIADLGGWEFVGKVTVRGNERPGSAEIRWVDQGEVSDITLSGPGGFKASTLKITPGSVVLKRSDGQLVRAENPDELVQKMIGWPMPLSLLADWVLGLPGDAHVLARDSSARLEAAQYREWSGQFSQYKSVDGLDLPHRLDVTDGHLRLTVRPKTWALNQPTADSTNRVPIPGLGG